MQAICELFKHSNERNIAVLQLDKNRKKNIKKINTFNEDLVWLKWKLKQFKSRQMLWKKLSVLISSQRDLFNYKLIVKKEMKFIMKLL